MPHGTHTALAKTTSLRAISSFLLSVSLCLSLLRRDDHVTAAEKKNYTRSALPLPLLYLSRPSSVALDVPSFGKAPRIPLARSLGLFRSPRHRRERLRRRRVVIVDDDDRHYRQFRDTHECQRVCFFSLSPSPVDDVARRLFRSAPRSDEGTRVLFRPGRESVSYRRTASERARMNPLGTHTRLATSSGVTSENVNRE